MNYVTFLATDDVTYSNPVWKEIERAILSLDGQERTIVTLAPSSPGGVPDGDQHMSIGGGHDGRVVVYMTVDNMQFWNLADPREMNSEGTARMVVGGQEGLYLLARLVTPSLALRAARQYVTDGTRCEDLLWLEE